MLTTQQEQEVTLVLTELHQLARQKLKLFNGQVPICVHISPDSICAIVEHQIEKDGTLTRLPPACHIVLVKL